MTWWSLHVELWFKTQVYPLFTVFVILSLFYNLWNINSTFLIELLEFDVIICCIITIYIFYCEDLKVAFKDKKERDHIKMYVFIIISAIELNICLFICFLCTAAPVACGNFQTRGQIGATAEAYTPATATPHPSRFCKPRQILQTTPQLCSHARFSTRRVRPGIETWIRMETTLGP